MGLRRASTNLIISNNCSLTLVHLRNQILRTDKQLERVFAYFSGVWCPQVLTLLSPLFLVLPCLGRSSRDSGETMKRMGREGEDYGRCSRGKEPNGRVRVGSIHYISMVPRRITNPGPRNNHNEPVWHLVEIVLPPDLYGTRSRSLLRCNNNCLQIREGETEMTFAIEHPLPLLVRTSWARGRKHARSSWAVKITTKESRLIFLFAHSLNKEVAEWEVQSRNGQPPKCIATVSYVQWFIIARKKLILTLIRSNHWSFGQ